MKILLFFLMIFQLAVINGQTNEPFKFENDIAKWVHKSVVEEFEGEIFAYQSFIPIEKGNDIYLSHNIQKGFFAGHITEKIDASDGRLLWKHYYLKEKNKPREYTQRPYLEGDTLKMLIFREYSKDDSIYGGLAWRRAVLSQISLDTDTGEKVDSIVTKGKDTLNHILKMPISLFRPYLTYFSLTPMGDNFLYLIRNGISRLVAFNYKLLNKQGHIINDTVVFQNDSIVGYKSLIYMSSLDITDSLTMLLKHFNVYKNPFSLLYEYYDKQGNFSKQVDISTSVEAAYQFNLDYADKDNFIVYARDTIYKNGSRYKQKRYYLFNKNGELLEKVSFDNEKNEPYYEISKPIVVDNKMFFGVVRDDDQGYQNLFFLKSNGVGRLDTLKVLKVDNEKDKIDISNMLITHKDELLINFFHIDISRPKKSYNSIWMMFDKKSIGLSTSTKEELYAKLQDIKLYPNPATDIIQLETGKSLGASIFIYDIRGKLVVKEKINSCKNNISISRLLPGEYFVKIKTLDGVEILNKKFLKE